MALANNILVRLCGLEGSDFEVRDVKVFEDRVVWQIEHQVPARYICSACGKAHSSAHELKWIKIEDVPLGNKRQIWQVKRARVLCDCSLRPRLEKMDFRSKHHRLTQRFVNFIEQVLCSHMFTVADVSRLFDLDYGVIYKIDHDVLLRLWQEMQIPDPINISVDEKSFKKGHSYVTIVTDTDLKKVIWVSPGRDKQSLDMFFQVLGDKRCQKIQTVSKDLHKPYADSCHQYIPQAMEVADPFHVVRRLNEAIDDSRKELSIGSMLRVSKRKFIGNLQWVLRYKQENMKAGHLASLDALAKVNEPLYHAYLLKESFYEFFTYRPSECLQAKDFLLRWIVDAFKIGLKGLSDFAEYINRNQQVLLNIILTKRSSAISEGINTKVTVIKRMAYGYKSLQYFMLKIMQRCGVLGSMWRPAGAE